MKTIAADKRTSGRADKRVDSCCGNVAGVNKRCSRPRVWSRWCKKHYLEEFGEAPTEVCGHGLDANHEPCEECFAPPNCVHGTKDSKACPWCTVARQGIQIARLEAQLEELQVMQAKIEESQGMRCLQPCMCPGCYTP